MNVNRSATVIKKYICLYSNSTLCSESESSTLCPPAASFQRQPCAHVTHVKWLTVISVIVFSPIRSRSSSGELLGPMLVDLVDPDLTSEIGFEPVRLCCVKVKATALTKYYQMISLKSDIRQVDSWISRAIGILDLICGDMCCVYSWSTIWGRTTRTRMHVANTEVSLSQGEIHLMHRTASRCSDSRNAAPRSSHRQVP